MNHLVVTESLRVFSMLNHVIARPRGASGRVKWEEPAIFHEATLDQEAVIQRGTVFYTKSNISFWLLRVWYFWGRNTPNRSSYVTPSENLRINIFFKTVGLWFILSTRRIQVDADREAQLQSNRPDMDTGIIPEKKR